MAACWHNGKSSALYQFWTQGYFQPEKSVRYLWEILQHLQNEYFEACPRTLTSKEQSELRSLQLYFENEIKSCTFIEIEYKKHPVYGYQYPDALSGADSITDFEWVKVPA